MRPLICRCRIGRDRSARPTPDTQADKGKAGDRNDDTDDDPDQLLHGVTPDNCRRPRLGLPGTYRGRDALRHRLPATYLPYCTGSRFPPPPMVADDPHESGLVGDPYKLSPELGRWTSVLAWVLVGEPAGILTLGSGHEQR